MSFPAVVIRKVLSVFRLIFSCLKSVFGRVCGWRSRSSNIAELPYTMPANLRVDNVNSRHIGAAPSAIDFGSRHGSSVEEPSSIELKIAEYRQQKHNEASMEAASVNEPDFFNEMEPQLKPTKKLKLRDLTRQADNAANTIFQVRDNATRLLEVGLVLFFFYVDGGNFIAYMDNECNVKKLLWLSSMARPAGKQ